ncbi:hypothetical protein Zmor_002214 [Zophobas morio]|uniref:Uncharacterized protein n=1 Tax=Zophobas morio TaxID=2755281 RepID=A0AA38J4A5_9CUCU|nr:hypothetical protein Zmor_002214 [Zophobas morio]
MSHFFTERILQAEEQILKPVEREPDIITRRLAAEVRVSQFLVHRTLKEQGLHPYHVQKVQALEPADFILLICDFLISS